MPTITVVNLSREMVRMGDWYVVNLELDIAYEGALSWSIPAGGRRVIDYSDFINELHLNMYPQIIRVLAGDAPELILCHSEFIGHDGGSLEFRMEPDDHRVPRLVHSFVAGNGGGGVTAFRKIWKAIMRGAAFFS